MAFFCGRLLAWLSTVIGFMRCNIDIFTFLRRFCFMMLILEGLLWTSEMYSYIAKLLRALHCPWWVSSTFYPGCFKILSTYRWKVNVNGFKQLENASYNIFLLIYHQQELRVANFFDAQILQVPKEEEVSLLLEIFGWASAYMTIPKAIFISVISYIKWMLSMLRNRTELWWYLI
jgi:hypothetical protein